MSNNRKGYLLPANVWKDNMVSDADVQKEMRKLREEVSELRNMVNLLLGLIMEEDEDGLGLEDTGPSGINEIYN